MGARGVMNRRLLHYLLLPKYVKTMSFNFVTGMIFDCLLDLDYSFDLKNKQSMRCARAHHTVHSCVSWEALVYII